MDANTDFEIKAEAFRLMTGHMAPGKDPGPAACQASYDERLRAWEEWLVTNDKTITALLRAVGTVCDIGDRYKYDEPGR